MEKRWMCLFLLVSLLASLWGCGRQGEGSSSPPAATTTTAVTPLATTNTGLVTTTTTRTTVANTTTVVPTTDKLTTTTRPSVATRRKTAKETTAATTTLPPTTVAPPTARPEVTVTIPEGYSFMQIAWLLEDKGVCKAADFYKVAQSYTPQSFSIPISEERCFRMEGYLFPDTYRFYMDDDPQTVLIRMLNNFRDRVGVIDDDTLILASIIEREARSDKHMRLVSSVFTNRLNDPTFYYLNTDPTREYVNKYITGNRLVKNQQIFASLYNTCGKRIGLPAGPICCPGLRAIQAAKKPAESPYFYFFFGKDNDNHYTVTLEEHEQAMKEFGVQTGDD